jgi:AraC-like DNA-binding protein
MKENVIPHLLESLVGNVLENDLQNVDCYVGPNMGIFIPSVGFCQYAIRPRHVHPAYSFYLFFSPEHTIVPTQIEIPPNHYLVVAMSPEVPHEEMVEDSFTRYMAIFIARELFEQQQAFYGCRQDKKYFWEQFVVEDEIMFYLKQYMSECENTLPGNAALLESLCTLIGHRLIRSILRIEKPSEILSARLEIVKTIEFMHQHFSEKITEATLSKLVHMSDSHFIRLFKNETDITPMEYLMRMRIDKAKKLLQNSARHITEIAFECGFNSLSYFSLCFTKHIGISPRDFQATYSAKRK